jgi:hypothetical protein
MTQPAKLRFFLDSEFNEHAGPFRLDPISISLVPEDTAAPDFYGVSAEFDATKITPWLQDNVVKHLPPEADRRTNAQIRDDMIDYVKSFGPADKVEIWAYNGATDQVVMANFFGGLMNMRKVFNDTGFKTVEFRDLKELTRASGVKLPPPENAHDCYADALWTRELFSAAEKKLPKDRRFLIE